jgi:predicted nucleic-acid-binding Zn-ribbon protein
MCSPKCPKCDGRDWKYSISPRGTLATRIVSALCLACGYVETYLRTSGEDLEHEHRVAAVQDRTRAA